MYVCEREREGEIADHSLSMIKSYLQGVHATASIFLGRGQIISSLERERAFSCTSQSSLDASESLHDEKQRSANVPFEQSKKKKTK